MNKQKQTSKQVWFANVKTSLVGRGPSNHLGHRRLKLSFGFFVIAIISGQIEFEDESRLNVRREDVYKEGEELPSRVQQRMVRKQLRLNVRLSPLIWNLRRFFFFSACPGSIISLMQFHAFSSVFLLFGSGQFLQEGCLLGLALVHAKGYICHPRNFSVQVISCSKAIPKLLFSSCHSERLNLCNAII